MLLHNLNCWRLKKNHDFQNKTEFLSHIYVHTYTSHICLIAMYISSPASYNQTTNCSKPGDNSKAMHLASPSKRVSKLWRNSRGLWNLFFNTTNLHRSQVHLFKLFSSQLKDQTDFDSLINTMIIRLLNQNQSLGTFHEQKNSDA